MIIKKYEIDNAVVVNDYTGYIPYNLIEGLSEIIANYLLYGNARRDSSKYSDAFRELIELIDFDNLRGTYYLDKAILIVKDFSPKINLREAERRVKFNIPISLDEDDQQNYGIDVKAVLTQDIADTLDLGIENVENVNNTTTLPDDVLSVLKFHSDIANIIGADEPGIKANEARMRSYNQVVKIPKYNYGLPTFEYKLALHDYNLVQETDVRLANSKTSIYIDASPSINSQQKYGNVIKAILMQYKEQFRRNMNAELTLNLFTNKVIKTIVISSLADLEDCMHFQMPKISVSLKGISDVINYMAERPDESIIFVCDSDIHLQRYEINNVRGRKCHVIVVGDHLGGASILASNTRGKTFLV